MDKTTKLILGLIAVALIGINIQMWDGKLIKEAEALRAPKNYVPNLVFNLCYKGPKTYNEDDWMWSNRKNIMWGSC